MSVIKNHGETKEASMRRVGVAQPRRKILTVGGTQYMILGKISTSTLGSVLLCRNKQGTKFAMKTAVKPRDKSICCENPLEEIRINLFLQSKLTSSRDNVELIAQNSLDECGNILSQRRVIAVYEYMSGGDLFNFITSYKHQHIETQNKENISSFSQSRYKNRLLPMSTVQQIFCKLCISLDAIHSCGVAHLDLSLENILLDDMLNPKISDFGQAIFFDKNQTVMPDLNGPCRGKQFYRAPEIYKKIEFDPILVDVFALGVILYMMLFSSPPFEQARSYDSQYKYFKNGEVSEIEALLKHWHLDNYVSKEALDLMSLTLCESNRCTLKNVLTHPFLTMKIHE